MWRDLNSYIKDCLSLAFKADGLIQFAINIGIPSALILLSFVVDTTGIREGASKLTAYAAVAFFGVNMFVASPFKLYRAHVAKIEALTAPVLLRYEHVEPWFSKNREHYHDDRVAVEISVRRRLRQVRCSVQKVRRRTELGWSDTLNGVSSFTLGFPDGEESWRPKDVPSNEFFILFHHRDGKLSVFTDRKYPELRGWIDDLPIGYYRFEVEIDAQNLDLGVRKYIEVDWSGSIDDLKIEIVDPKLI